MPRIPWPSWPTVTFRLRADNSSCDVPNAEIRAKNRAGIIYSVPATRVSLGTYRSTNFFVCDTPGPWHFEGHSPVIGDLVKSDEVTIEVDDSLFPQSDYTGGSVYPGSIGVPSLTLRLTVTSGMLLAGTPVVLPLPWVPQTVLAFLSGGAVVSDIASVDGVTAQVTVAMTDPALVAGNQIVIVVTR